MAKANYSGTSAETQVTRRNIITAAPIALAMGGIAVEASTETPVAVLFRQWQVANEIENKALDKSDDWDDAECTAAYRERARIEDLLMEEPCRNAGDFICKVIAWTAYGVCTLQDESENPKLWTEARALVGA